MTTRKASRVSSAGPAMPPGGAVAGWRACTRECSGITAACRVRVRQERSLQASSVVPRVERAAAALGILRHPPMPNAPTFRDGADRRDPTHHPSGVGDVRPAFSQEADANRRRDGFGGGVAPVGGGHLLARQVQREGLPLRREFDRQLLGPDRRSLLPRRVRRTHPTSRHVAPRRLFLSGRSDAKERRFLVALGKSALNRSDALEQTFRVDRIVVRPDFNNEDGNYDNDVALMKLKPKEDGRCARESRAVRAACLPAPGRELPGPGSTCEIAGFGKEKHGLWYHSQFLLRASVDLLADDVCRRDDYYGDKISGNMLCAGRPDWSRDACEGDSGGPLVCPVGGRMLLLGVISWGEGCARDRRPGVYAKVLNYRAWIREHARV
ncbi:plasminogen activator, urokinase b isoform X4 [Syngnathoides biaculeatus]|uniref:plasminogen activator, urokinase b isoform X4 n=1 Tax=Syngnathoides biaculeatus TaxID=300417 RepID=UPI002ADE23EE|nr:plasminogen activator, urokinase b isoform X4 [Syngnathoides biaculeatus]